MATNENLPPNVVKQLAKELKNLDEAPPEGIKVGVNDEDFSTIYADIEGPAGTPYENGVFRMKLILSHDFPHSPPKGVGIKHQSYIAVVRSDSTLSRECIIVLSDLSYKQSCQVGYFLTKIFHPNIATNGEICVNTLKKDWNPSLGLRHVLIVVRCLLIEPFPESALNEQAGKMLLENYDEYARHARLYTGIHALKQKPKFKTGAISESTTALNVDQTNTSALNVDQKNAAAGAALQLPSPLAPNTNAAAKGASGQDQPTAVPNSVTETGVGGSITSATAAPVVVLKKEVVGLTKVNADKRKMDARKKSLKRL